MILHVLSCVAITCIIVHSEIFRPVRELALKLNQTLGYWISCPMCLGLWTGISYGFIVGDNPITLGLLSSLSSWTVYNLVTAFGALGDYYTTMLQNGESNDE